MSCVVLLDGVPRWMVQQAGWQTMHMELLFQFRCGFLVLKFSGFSLFGITPIDRTIYFTAHDLHEGITKHFIQLKYDMTQHIALDKSEALTYRTPQTEEAHH